MEPQDLKEEVFARHLNTKFYIPMEQGRVELELVKVIGDKSSMNKIKGVERFAIYFLGPGDLLLPQSIYHLEHEAMGEMDIFIVPVGTQDGRYQYEAVFNYMES